MSVFPMLLSKIDEQLDVAPERPTRKQDIRQIEFAGVMLLVEPITTGTKSLALGNLREQA